MFVTMTKQMVINHINNESTTQQNSGDRRLALKGRINAMIAKMVANSNVQEFNQIAYTKNSGLNKGYIVEKVVLDWAGLEQENENCEVKFFGNDTPNELVNENTKRIYIVIAKATNRGAYVIDNMDIVRGHRLTLRFLKEHNLLTNHCESLERYLGI